MKPTLKRHWPLLGLGALLALVGFYLLQSGEVIFKRAIFRGAVPGEGLKLQDIHYVHDDPGSGMKWILDAKEVHFSGDKSFITFEAFRLMLEPQSRPWFKLNGNRGRYSRESGEINLWGDVKGFSENGYRICSQHILINEKQGHLGTDKPVKLFGPFFSVAGQGLFVDLENERAKVLSEVTTIINKDSIIL